MGVLREVRIAPRVRGVGGPEEGGTQIVPDLVRHPARYTLTPLSSFVILNYGGQVGAETGISEPLEPPKTNPHSLGANSANNLSKRGSLRKGSHSGSRFNWP
jgi:hypothetical protein